MRGFEFSNYEIDVEFGNDGITWNQIGDDELKWDLGEEVDWGKLGDELDYWPPIGETFES